ncbi:MAG: hypothetical protein ABGW87_09840 [Sphingomonadaceae bacterium]
MIRRLLPALLAASVLAGIGPAQAQDQGGDKVQMVIVYGDDPAPKPQGDEIVVVARLPEADRYRIPKELRDSDDPQNTSWTSRVQSLEFVGNFGTLSCSPTGAGGSTGCTQEMIRKAYADKKASPSVRFGELIAAARKQRLASIDKDATAEQARVEQLEKEYMERMGKSTAPPPPASPPVVVASEKPAEDGHDQK